MKVLMFFMSLLFALFALIGVIIALCMKADGLCIILIFFVIITCLLICCDLAVNIDKDNKLR